MRNEADLRVADAHALAVRAMKRQIALALKVAAVFILILIGLPLVNLYAPDFAATKVMGFSVTWLFLAVLFYPITWVLSYWFVSGSDRIEASIVKEHAAPLIGAGAVEAAPVIEAGTTEPAVTPPPTTEKKKLFVDEEEGA